MFLVTAFFLSTPAPQATALAAPQVISVSDQRQVYALMIPRIDSGALLLEQSLSLQDAWSGDADRLKECLRRDIRAPRQLAARFLSRVATPVSLAFLLPEGIHPLSAAVLKSPYRAPPDYWDIVSRQFSSNCVLTLSALAFNDASNQAVGCGARWLRYSVETSCFLFEKRDGQWSVVRSSGFGFTAEQPNPALQRTRYARR